MFRNFCPSIVSQFKTSPGQVHPKKFKALNNSGLPYTYYACYLAEWLERLDVNAKVATVLCSISASSLHSGIWGVADEAVVNNVHILRSFTWLALRGCSVSFTLLYDEARFHFETRTPTVRVCRVLFLSISEDAEFHSATSNQNTLLTLRVYSIAEFLTSSTQSNNFIRTHSWLCKSADLYYSFESSTLLVLLAAEFYLKLESAQISGAE
jgi:hypothetical protein